MSEEVLGFRIEVKGTDQQTAEMQKLSGEIDSIKKRMVELNKQKKTEEGLTAAQRKEWVLLNTQLKASQTQYNQVNKAILTNNGVLKQSNGLFGGFKQAIGSSIVSMVGWTAAIGAVIGAVGSAIKTVRDFDESVANLQKVTGLAKGEARDLAKEIIKIDTRTSVTALLELATAGGRLGLSGQELIGFTRAADMAFVALGDSLEGDAEQIATTLGKLGDSFGLEKKYGIEGSLTRIGSVLNDLGAKTKAQEGPIVDFTARLAGVASQAGITLPEIAALGALFDANGQSMEIAATTFQKLLPDMGANVEQFAKVAGMDVEEFSTLLRDKPFAALQAVAKGAQSSEKGLIGLTDTLKNYGVDSARAASIVSLLSSKQAELATMVGYANSALEENTSLQKENAIKQETLDAKIGQLSKTWDVFILSMDGSESIIGNAFKGIIDFAERAVIGFQNLGAIADITFGGLTSASKESKEAVFNGWEIEDLGMRFNDFTKNFDAIPIEKIKSNVKETQKTFQDFLIKNGETAEDATELWNIYINDRLAKEISLRKSLKETKKTQDETVGTGKSDTNIGLADKFEQEKKQREKDQKEREDAKKKELETFRKYEEEYEKARAKGEKEAQDFLKKQKEEFGLSTRELELLNITREFDAKMAAIIGSSVAEIELRKQIEEQKRIALQEQKLVWATEDIEAQAVIDEENLAKEIAKEQAEIDRKRQHELFKQKVVSDSLGIVQTLSTVASNNELARFDADAKKQLDSFNGTEEQKKQLQEKLNQERYQIEKKAFERRQKLQLLEIGINLIKELSSIQANAAGNPANAFTFGAAGVTQAAVLSALAIAGAAANTAAVMSQKYADGGLVQGASHQQGGVQMFHKSGQHIGEMEGNEYIFSKKRVKEIGVSNLDAMNFGGVTPDVGRYFADGGLVPNTNGMSTTTNGVGQMFNMEEMAALMTDKMQETILRTEIVNNATDTYGVAADVINTKNSLSFG